MKTSAEDTDMTKTAPTFPPPIPDCVYLMQRQHKDGTTSVNTSHDLSEIRADRIALLNSGERVTGLWVYTSVDADPALYAEIGRLRATLSAIAALETEEPHGADWDAQAVAIGDTGLARALGRFEASEMARKGLASK